jgi:hypothetical protein
MLTIDGMIVSGLGVASRTLKLQLPKITQIYPDLNGLHEATINVILDAQLEVVKPDIVTDPLKWHPDARTRPVMFGFLTVRFEVPAAGVLVDAWIYIPYDSPHRKNPYYAEVLTQEL